MGDESPKIVSNEGVAGGLDPVGVTWGLRLIGVGVGLVLGCFLGSLPIAGEMNRVSERLREGLFLDG